MWPRWDVWKRNKYLLPSLNFFYSDFDLKAESMWHSHNQNMFQLAQYREIFEKLLKYLLCLHGNFSLFFIFFSEFVLIAAAFRWELCGCVPIAREDTLLCYVFNAMVHKSYIKLFHILNVWQKNRFSFILPKWIECLSCTSHSRKEEGCPFKTFSIFRMALCL